VTNPRITFSRSASVLFVVLLAVIVRSASPSADAQQSPAAAASATAVSQAPTAVSQAATAVPQAATAVPQAATAVPQAATAAPAAASAEATFLNQYCIGCHNQRAKVGGLALDTLDVTRVAPASETWEKVVKKIRTGMMPPSGAKRPERNALDRFAAELESRLDKSVDPNAALVTPALHRLNRTEYANAIRDLLGLDINVNALLPADGSSEGFDNLAEALAVSPSLIQAYVSAAMKISRLAVGDRTLAPAQTTFAPPPGLAQDRHIDGLPLGTRGGVVFNHTFPLDAEYEFAFGGRGAGPGGLDLTLDGAQVKVDNPRGFRMNVTAGPHAIGLALVDRQRGAGVDEIYSDFRTNATFTTQGGVPTLVVTGPFNATGPGDTPSRRAIFSCKPTSAADETTCARTILSSLARRAYRGPVSAAEVNTLLEFYREGRKSGDFDNGIQQALARILVAPRFVYRIEEEPTTVASGQVYRISDVELASRLSFFLWSSIPDEELRDVATKGRLRDPQTLAQQVKRMLADQRADAIVENFAGQWLYLRELENVQTEARNFDENLRRSFRRETEMMFDAIVREDRSLIDLLDADYTFVDERLARHYGIPNVKGSYFRRVSLAADSPRRGLLGQGSVLTVTSTATRTSPVVRGKWVLENLLGTPAPVPPPGVETNLGGAEGAKTSSVRERLEAHRASPTCASCHRIMDPMGFALENFDLVGGWREFDGPSRIDSKGQLADGTPVSGPADLRQAVLSRSDTFMTTATEKLMTYALGRPVHNYDMPTVRAIVRRAGNNNNRFSSLVMGIIESDSFQKRVKK
jgi:mono/diheme cytochrome c family protein